MTPPNLYIVGTIHNDFKGPQRLESLLQRLKPEIVAVESSKKMARKYPRQLSQRVLKAMALGRAREAGKRFGLTPAQQRTYAAFSYTLASVKNYELYISRGYTARSCRRRIGYIDEYMEQHSHADEAFRKIRQISHEIDRNHMKQSPALAEEFKELLSKGIRTIRQARQRRTDGSYWQYKILKKKISDASAWYQRERERFTDPDNREKEAVLQMLDLAYAHIAGKERERQMAARVHELYTKDSRLQDGNAKMLVVCGIGHLYSLEELLSDLKPRALPLNEYDKV